MTGRRHVRAICRAIRIDSDRDLAGESPAFSADASIPPRVETFFAHGVDSCASELCNSGVCMAVNDNR
jgi:hypothetical protein